MYAKQGRALGDRFSGERVSTKLIQPQKWPVLFMINSLSLRGYIRFGEGHSYGVRDPTKQTVTTLIASITPLRHIAAMGSGLHSIVQKLSDEVTFKGE